MYNVQSTDYGVGVTGNYRGPPTLSSAYIRRHNVLIRPCRLLTLQKWFDLWQSQKLLWPLQNNFVTIYLQKYLLLSLSSVSYTISWSLAGNNAILLATYNFLLVFHWNYVSILHCFWNTISLSLIAQNFKQSCNPEHSPFWSNLKYRASPIRTIWLGDKKYQKWFKWPWPLDYVPPVYKICRL